MRRLLFAVLAATLTTAVGCHDSPLGPVQTVDGSWSGVQNGFSLGLTLAQADTIVSGSASIASLGGTFVGTASGTFKYPKLALIIHVDGFEDANYSGTMSTSEAKIFGVLSGSGISNAEVDVRKK
jgi:hypothetical protein